MKIYIKIFGYAISFGMLFFNPLIAFFLLIVTHGLVWYVDNKNQKENQNEKPDPFLSSEEHNK